eukprot:2922613-Pyramimonas_sp.AAC.1
MDQCTTGLRDSHSVLIRKPIEVTARHGSLLTPLDRKRCTGRHQRASVCNRELAKAAQYISKKQPLFVEAVRIAYEMFAVNRDPFHNHHHASSVLVTNAR